MIRPCERCLGAQWNSTIYMHHGGWGTVHAALCSEWQFCGWSTVGYKWCLKFVHWCVSLPAFLSLICLKRAAMSKRSNSAQSQPQATAMWMCVRLQSLHIDALLQTFEGPLIICISEQFVKFIYRWCCRAPSCTPALRAYHRHRLIIQQVRPVNI